MLIDIHAHMGKGVDPNNPLQSNISSELILRYAKEANLDKTVIFPVNYSEYSEANKEISDAVKKYPDELVGFARVNPNNEKASYNLKIAVEELGLKGLKLHPGNDDFQVPDPRVTKIIELAGELSIPVIFDSTQQLDGLIQLAKDNPSTNVILAHMGGFYDWRGMRKCIQWAQQLSNLYLDTAFVLIQKLLKEAVEELPNKIFMGTDSPAVHPKVEMRKIKTLNLSPRIERKVLGENAAELLCL